ncbi:MAG: hypothetical protein WAK61_18115 [Leclercia sp.]|uniref:Uncharacterized protein n=1 Tax=Silvania hatchlandensis TaxID=2926469 RepID=A0A9J6PXX9_9ENTR|nr:MULTISPECIES: hypothetical protein [Enterobacteriaceae]MCU6664328.1 hypothetical protein [Silvania hatchlandensis]
MTTKPFFFAFFFTFP